MPKVIIKTKTKGKIVPAKAKNTLVRVGRELGSLAAGPIGGHVGAFAGKAISKILGMGEYTIRGNTLACGQAPSFTSTENGMRICHREYISDVFTSQDFVNQKQYYINPGNNTLFPWLSTVANSFEQYELHGLVVTYRPTSGSAISSTSAAMGSIILSTEYDVLKPAFTSKREAESYMFTTMSVPYEGMLHPIECKPSLTVLPKKFVTGALTPAELELDDDPRLHYQGLLQMMVTGQQSSGPVCGELWVSYDISLYTPRLPPVVSNMARSMVLRQGTSPVVTNQWIATQTTSSIFSTINPIPVPTISGYYSHFVQFLVPGVYKLSLIASSTAESTDLRFVNFFNRFILKGDTEFVTLIPAINGSDPILENNYYASQTGSNLDSTLAEGSAYSNCVYVRVNTVRLIQNNYGSGALFPTPNFSSTGSGGPWPPNHGCYCLESYFVTSLEHPLSRSFSSPAKAIVQKDLEVVHGESGYIYTETQGLLTVEQEILALERKMGQLKASRVSN